MYQIPYYITRKYAEYILHYIINYFNIINLYLYITICTSIPYSYIRIQYITLLYLRVLWYQYPKFSKNTLVLTNEYIVTYRDWKCNDTSKYLPSTICVPRDQAASSFLPREGAFLFLLLHYNYWTCNNSLYEYSSGVARGDRGNVPPRRNRENLQRMENTPVLSQQWESIEVESYNFC